MKQLIILAIYVTALHIVTGYFVFRLTSGEVNYNNQQVLRNVAIEQGCISDDDFYNEIPDDEPAR